ncbi:MAG: hypothetical protein RMK20_08785, partial [Verrucomicrobiales bacterium]|nr:hypothetical protein [Verrucomicrobiales bacterium]
HLLLRFTFEHDAHWLLPREFAACGWHRRAGWSNRGVTGAKTLQPLVGDGFPIGLDLWRGRLLFETLEEPMCNFRPRFAGQAQRFNADFFDV